MGLIQIKKLIKVYLDILGYTLTDVKTTIKVSKKLVLELAKLKIHPRQSNEEVISRLIEKHGKI